MGISVSANQHFVDNATPQEIERALIPHLHFPKEEVLHLKFDRLKREKDLEQADVLGNIYESQVTIIFEDIEGPKKVISEVSSVTNTEVILIQNIPVPIHRIVSVNY